MLLCKPPPTAVETQTVEQEIVAQQPFQQQQAGRPQAKRSIRFAEPKSFKEYKDLPLPRQVKLSFLTLHEKLPLKDKRFLEIFARDEIKAQRKNIGLGPDKQVSQLGLEAVNYYLKQALEYKLKNGNPTATRKGWT